jgi:crotonobetainyl-CoA:carnitine CoA-transferase CaiB-like acyl-CoA transferase
MTGALAGLRVIDLTRYIPGPYCTMALGDLGADVIKVEEPPFGDATRALPPAAGEDSAAHAALNRNKRSIVVDVRTERGAELVRRLAQGADVFVEAFRPGALARRGLGADALLAENPRLIYCSITGYGQAGPLSARAGHDINYAARAGFLGSNGVEGRPAIPGGQVADMAGAFVALLGILAALQARERTGLGQRVDASMLSGLLGVMSLPLARHLAGGAGDELTGRHACYNVYRCRDGHYLSVGALEPKFWEALCQALELPELAKRQWAREERQREMIVALAAAFARRDRSEWLAVFDGIEACVEPVLDLHEASQDAQVAQFLVDPQPGLRTVGFPALLSATPAATSRPAPALGQHTDEVLAELAVPTSEVARLREEGVVA